jgi:hypothetical protein
MLVLLAPGAGCLRTPNPAYLVDLNRDAGRASDTMGAPSPVPEPPRTDALSVQADAGAAPDAIVAVPSDAPTSGEAGPPDTSLPSPDAPIDTRPDGALVDLPSGPSVTLDKATYDPGEAIVASFSNGPGNYADWIGIYDQNAPAPSDSNRSLLWYYTDNKGWETRGGGSGPKNGTVTFSAGAMGSLKWPLPSGRYKVLFLSSPHTQLGAPANFQVR